MYTLQVFFGSEPSPRETHRVTQASSVLTRIPELLGAHAGCEKIVVLAHGVKLFSVDCHGNTLED